MVTHKNDSTLIRRGNDKLFYFVKVIGGDIIDRISENDSSRNEIRYGQVKVINIGELTKKGNYRIELLRNKSLSLSRKEFWDNHK